MRGKYRQQISRETRVVIVTRKIVITTSVSGRIFFSSTHATIIYKGILHPNSRSGRAAPRKLRYSRINYFARLQQSSKFFVWSRALPTRTHSGRSQVDLLKVSRGGRLVTSLSVAMLRPSFLLLALAACALAASIPAVKEEASSTVAAAAAPKAAAPAPKAAAPKAVQAGTKSQAQAIYTSKFDNVNLDQILKSERLLNNYHKCLMDRGPCTPDAAELKRKFLDKSKYNKNIQKSMQLENVQWIL